MTTKWIAQAPFAFIVSQIGLYIALQAHFEEKVNEESSDMTHSEIIGSILLNTYLPVLMLFVSFSLQRNKVYLYLSKIREAIGQIEMHKIIKMVPQALFFVDDRTEEIMQQSKAMKAFFG